MKIFEVKPEEPKTYEGYIVHVDERGTYSARLVISPDAEVKVDVKKTERGESKSISVGQYDWVKAAKVDVPFNSNDLSWDWFPAKVRLTVTEKPEVESTPDNYRLTMKTHYSIQDLEGNRQMEDIVEDFTNTGQVMSRRTLEGVLEKVGGRTYENMTLVRVRQPDGTKEVLAFYATPKESGISKAYGHKVKLEEEIIEENIFGLDRFFNQTIFDLRTGKIYEGQTQMCYIPEDKLKKWKAEAKIIKEMKEPCSHVGKSIVMF